MICKVCELEFVDLSQNIGTCPECLRTILVNSVPDDEDSEIDDALDAEEDEYVEPYYTGIEEEPQMPEDEDLVTKDYVTFYRFGMGEVAFEVPVGCEWQDAAKFWMEKEQYWPSVWLKEERGGYTNITTESP